MNEIIEATDMKKKAADKSEKIVIKNLLPDLIAARPDATTAANDPKKRTSVCLTGSDARELPTFVPPSLNSTPQQDVMTLGSILPK